MQRIIGIPGDLVRHNVTFAQGRVPNLWGHVFMKIREVHARGITGKGVRISINDTGVAKHDLLPKPLAARSFVNAGLGDPNGHGSHCAGIALGRGYDPNGFTIGVAPDADLIYATVLAGNGSGSTTGINAGRRWAAEQGADIISESLGDNGGPDIPEDIAAYEYAYEQGTAICLAALGNAGFNGRNTVGRPASYKENLGIAALKEDGSPASFSSGGPTADYACPGQNIISCGTRNDLQMMSGTSQATPFAAGTCALVIQWHRMMGMRVPKGWKEWREYFKPFSVDWGTPGHDPRTGFGIPMMVRVLDSLVPPEFV